MSLTNTILIAIGVIIDLAFIFIDNKYHNKYSIILKTAASLVFVVLGIVNMHNRDSILVVIALAFDCFGDLVLILRNINNKRKNELYIIGTLSFLIAHVFLIVFLFITRQIPLIKCTIISAILLAILEFSFVLRFVDDKRMIALGSVYLYSILTTSVASVFSYLGCPNASSLLFMLGSNIFTISDVILIIHKYGKKEINALQITYRELYYVSQLMIALSLCY